MGSLLQEGVESRRAFANVLVPYVRETSKLSTLISGAA